MGGVELAHVDSLNLLQLAPGGHLGRFCVWTQGAFEKLDTVFGTMTKPSSSRKHNGGGEEALRRAAEEGGGGQGQARRGQAQGHEQDVQEGQEEGGDEEVLLRVDDRRLESVSFQ